MALPHLSSGQSASVGAPSSLPTSSPPLGERRSEFLLPGELHASAEPCQIRTILGSCVAICLWDSQLRIGGMNHFLLPASSAGHPASSRFADVATRTLLDALQSLRCRVPDLQAKIFGGASMFQKPDRRVMSLGAQNVAAALELMRNARIPVAVQETGGIHGRKIMLNTDDGVVWCQRIQEERTRNNGF